MVLTFSGYQSTCVDDAKTPIHSSSAPQVVLADAVPISLASGDESAQPCGGGLSTPVGVSSAWCVCSSVTTSGNFMRDWG